MAITVELDAFHGLRIVDTAVGQQAINIPVTASITVAEWVSYRLPVVSGASNATVTFGSVAAGKIFACRASGALTLKLNGSATAVPVSGLLIIVDSTGGGLTSATVSNASGGDLTLDVFIAGLT